jgi:hypothetical protein
MPARYTPSPATDRVLGDVRWPADHTPVSVVRRRALREADPGSRLAPGDRINLLVRSGDEGSGQADGQQ